MSLRTAGGRCWRSNWRWVGAGCCMPGAEQVVSVVLGAGCRARCAPVCALTAVTTSRRQGSGVWPAIKAGRAVPACLALLTPTAALPAASLAHTPALPAACCPLQAVGVPVSIVWGKEDPWEKYEWGQQLAKYPSVQEFVALPGVGHCPQVSLPAAACCSLSAPLWPCLGFCATLKGGAVLRRAWL